MKSPTKCVNRIMKDVQNDMQTPFLAFFDSKQGGRSENQDFCICKETPLGMLVVVCDGMGGGPAGSIASKVSAEKILDVIDQCSPGFNREKAFELAVDSAQNELLEMTDDNPELTGMGTTLVALLINEDSAFIAHIGDSRCYKIRSGTKVFRTKDHSVVGEMVRNKTLTEEQARLSAQSNIITRAIGSSSYKAEYDEVAYEKGDCFFLCTDGIWGAMPETELIKRFSSKKNFEGLAERIALYVDQIGDKNGGHHDNLTIAVVKTNINSKLKEKMNRKSKLIILLLSIICAISLFTNIMLSCRSCEKTTIVASK